MSTSSQPGTEVPGVPRRAAGHGWLNYVVVAPLALSYLPFMARGPTLHFLFVAVTWAVAMRALLLVGGNRRLKVPVGLSSLNLLIVILFMGYSYQLQSPSTALQEVYYWARRFLVYTRPALYTLIYLWAVRRGMREKATKYTVIGAAAFMVVFTVKMLQGWKFSQASIVYRFHNAFFACLAMVILFHLIHLMQTRELSPPRMFLVISLCIVLFAVPFFGFLRAGSMIMMILVALMLLMYGIRIRMLYIGLLVLFAGSGLWLMVDERVAALFSENLYGYRNPIEVLQAATRTDDPNAVSRITWWKESALPIFEANPLLGSSFTAEFSIYDDRDSPSGVGYFHNFWVTMLVDGGLILGIPHLLLQFYPIVVGIGLIRRGDKRPVPYVLWVLAVLLTNLTNPWGHTTFHSEIEFMIFGLATASIVEFRLDRKRAGPSPS